MTRLHKAGIAAATIASALGLALYPLQKGYASVPGNNTLISMNSANTQGAANNWYRSEQPSASKDGKYIAFSSDATDLVSGDTNHRTDVFVRNTSNNTTQRVSVDSGGNQRTTNSSGEHISSNGKYVIYNNDEDNGNVYLYSIDTATTTLVSVASGGGSTSAGSFGGGVSDDGRFVLISSSASNLISGMTTTVNNIYVRDTALNTTQLISKANGSSGQANNNSGLGGIKTAMSCDGRFVAYLSDATNIVSGDTNGQTDIFLVDRVGGDLTKDITNNGDGQSLFASVSCDGNYVGVSSAATNLVSGQTSTNGGAFVYDRVANNFNRVDVSSAGTQSNGSGLLANISISDGGRYVAYTSDATNLVSENTGGKRQAYLRDRQSSTTELLSRDSSDQAGDYDTDEPFIIADGSKVVFYSRSTNLQATYTPSWQNVYVADTGVASCSQ